MKEAVDEVIEYIWRYAGVGMDLEEFFTAVRDRLSEEVLDLMAPDDDGSE
jgi:hypothetical protein